MNLIKSFFKHCRIFVLATTVLLTCCTDYESTYTNAGFQIETRSFDGAIYDYLLQGDAELGIRYDSMMLLVNGITGRKELLSDESVELTVFAVPDESFQATVNTFNRVRQSSNRNGIQLHDLLIEPFVIMDSVYRPSTIDPMVNDTIVTERWYDYRKQADTLLCRYIFEGIYDLAAVSENFRGIEPGCIIYNIKMNIQSERHPSSGILNIGMKRIIFSDMNNSKLTTEWIRSATQQIDIRTRNGVVHVLSTGHEFSFNEFFFRFKNYGYE